MATRSARLVLEAYTGGAFRDGLRAVLADEPEANIFAVGCVFGVDVLLRDAGWTAVEDAAALIRGVETCIGRLVDVGADAWAVELWRRLRLATADSAVRHAPSAALLDALIMAARRRLGGAGKASRHGPMADTLRELTRLRCGNSPAGSSWCGDAIRTSSSTARVPARSRARRLRDRRHASAAAAEAKWRPEDHMWLLPGGAHVLRRVAPSYGASQSAVDTSVLDRIFAFSDVEMTSSC